MQPEPTYFPPVHVQALKEQLAIRRRKNPRYSLRAFARHLQVDPSGLSRILSGKKAVTVPIARQMVRLLQLAHDPRRIFLLSVAEEHKRAACTELSRELKLDSLDHETSPISEEAFRTIGNLKHLGCLEAVFLDGIDYGFAQVALAFGLSDARAKTVLKELEREGALVRRNGRLCKSSVHLAHRGGGPGSEDRRRHQREILKAAHDAVDSVPYEKRTLDSMTLAIDPEQLPLARQMIQRFAEELADFLGAHKKTSVYQLGIQLFPLQKEALENS